MKVGTISLFSLFRKIDGFLKLVQHDAGLNKHKKNANLKACVF